MHQALFYLASSFWAGVVHAATPGHGKTIAAAYIVGARGRPVDAVILGVFVTLSHVSGIVLVGVLASLGSSWLVPARTEATAGAGNGTTGSRARPVDVVDATRADRRCVSEAEATDRACARPRCHVHVSPDHHITRCCTYHPAPITPYAHAHTVPVT